MQQVDEAYRRILSGKDYEFEVSISVGESGILTDERGNGIVFGVGPDEESTILVDRGGPESGFREDQIIDVRVIQELFKNGQPEVGSAISAEIDLTMIAPFNVPKRGRIAPYIRAKNDVEVSGWVPQGIYFIDTREQTHDDRGFDVLTLHGFDAMLLTEQSFPSGLLPSDFPMLDTEFVQYIASHIKTGLKNDNGIRVDQRTWDIMTKGYKFPHPLGYSMREALGMVAASYGGNFIISPVGELRLVRLNDLPPETRVLINEDGYQIVFGIDDDGEPVKILV